jgi:hypothetical protein
VHSLSNSENEDAPSEVLWELRAIGDPGDLSQSAPVLERPDRFLSAPHRRTNSATFLIEKKARSRKSKKGDQSGAASIESITRDETPQSSSRRRHDHGPESVRDSPGLETDRTFVSNHTLIT